MKNIFNLTLSKCLEDDKEYNQKIAYRTLEDKYNWETNQHIKKICRYT